MMGKESNNYFTPITNLSQVAPNVQRRTINVNLTTNDTGVIETSTNHDDPQDHPVYGFKSGLIKVIGNMVYRNKMCQDLVSRFHIYLYKNQILNLITKRMQMQNCSSLDVLVVDKDHSLLTDLKFLFERTVKVRHTI